MSKPTVAEMKTALRTVPTDLLKLELARRAEVEKAKRHIESALASLERARAKVETYTAILNEDRDDETV